MFKKPVEAKSLQRLSGADKKKLRRITKERFPQASDADIDTILPPKVRTVNELIWPAEKCMQYMMVIRFYMANATS